MKLAVTELGEGPPLVLLHGLFGARQNFGAVQKALAGDGWRVIALDLRNHGASPHAPGMAYPDMAADVAETLQGLGAWPATVLGHSMGGKVAMALALARPEGIAGLIVADIAPVTYPAPLFAEYLNAMRAMPLAPGLTRREADAALALAVPVPALRAFLLQNLVFPEEVPRWRIGIGEIAAGMPEIAGWPALAGRYAGPTLVLAGSHSPYIRPEHHALFRALFPAVRFATIAAGHWLHAENPAAFLEEVRAFLAG